MSRPRIRLAFRQVIDADRARTDFEKAVFADTYHEFRVQIQTYNPDNACTTWQQVREAVPQSSPTLPIRVGFAIGLYVGELNNQIPGLTDVLDQPIAFSEHQFDLLASDLTDRSKHRVAITYLTDTFTWLDTVGSTLLLATKDPGTDPVDTVMVALQPSLSIVSYAGGPVSPA
jgi:hypothetical protein